MDDLDRLPHQGRSRAHEGRINTGSITGIALALACLVLIASIVFGS